MSESTLAAALISWTLQSTLLVGVGLLLPALFRLRAPRACLGYCQALLASALLLPFVQTGSAMASFAGELSVGGLAGFGKNWLGRLTEEGSGSWNVSRLLLAGLAAGAVLRFAWIVLGFLALRRHRRDARPLELAPEIAQLADFGEVRPRLLVSGRIGSPVTFGWRKPVILLHEGFEELPLPAQRGIVYHELIHVRRRDWLWALAEESIRALLWFHPAILLLLSRIALHREQVVDREAVRHTGSRRAYLEALRAVAFRARPETVPGLPFFHRGHLRERMALLCKEVSMSRSRLAALLSTCAGLLALTAVLGILAFPMAETAWAGGKPMKVEGDVQKPELVKHVEPVYPEGSKAGQAEGNTVLRIVIDEQGKVTQPKVEKSSGHKALDQAALDAVTQWEFKPATLKGKPVSVYYTLTLRFQVG
jgi:TonB family protein